MGNTNIWAVYLPVNSEPADKIAAAFEALSDVIIRGMDDNKRTVIIGDWNSHKHG